MRILFSLMVLFLFFKSTAQLTITTSASSATFTTTTVDNTVTISYSTSGNLNVTEITSNLNSGRNVIVAPSNNAVAENLTVVTDIIKSSGGENTLTLKSNQSVDFSGRSITSNSNKLNVIIWVEADGGTAYNAPLGNITTNGGHIWVGGGSGTKTWNSLTIGDGASYANTSGTVVAIPLYGNISTGGGDILLVAAATGSDGNGYVDIEAITSDREINSGSGDVTFLVEDIDFDWNNNDGIDIIITSTGVFTIAPTSQTNKWTNDFVWEGSTSNGNFSGTGDLVGIEINNISSLTGLSIGTFNDATYTPVDNVSVRNIDLNAPLSIGGAVTLYGLHINLNDISTTGSSGHLYVKAAGDIEQSLDDQISTTGGDVVYWADFDGNGGRITVKYHISTQGGNIWMGGGSSSETVGGLVVPTGYAKSITINQPGVNIDGESALAGIVINSRVSGNATGGSIRIKGIHDESGDGSSDIGVKIVDCDIYSSTGNISILGTTTNDLFQGAGLWIGTDIHSSASTGNVTITTTSGDIYLEGISASNVGTYQWAHGLMMFMNGGDDISIASTTGDIVLKGDGAVSSARSGEAGGLVVQVNNTSSFFSINTDGGAITFEGNSGNSGDDLGLCFRAQDIANNIKIGDNNTGNIIAKCGSLQTTARNTLGVIGFEGIGSYVFEPISTSFAVSPTITDEYSFASSGTGFRFGKTGNTSTTTIDIPISVNGPIEVYGGGVDIDGNLTSNNNPILLSASVNLQLAAGSSNITLNAGTGSVTLESNLIAFDGSTSTSNNTRTTSVMSTGVLTIRPHGASTSFNAGMLGGSDGSTGTQFDWTGALSGSTWQITSGTLKNLYINNFSSLGGLVLQKENVTTPVLISSPINVSGPITIYGGAIAVNANITATSGNILLDADLGTAIATGLDGINVADNVTIKTLTSGDITIIGRSGSGSGSNLIGYEDNANTVINSAGALTITGTGMSSGSSGTRGVTLQGTYTAEGDITITGDDNVASNKDGITLTAVDITSNNGSISFNTPGINSIYQFGTGINNLTAKNNINISTNKHYLTHVRFDADGVVNIIPSTGSTAFEMDIPIPAGFTFDTGIRGLTIGTATNDKLITLSTPIAIAGPVSVYGGAIDINANITATGGDILLDADLGNTIAGGTLDGIQIDDAITIKTVTSGNITLIGRSGDAAGIISGIDMTNTAITTLNSAGNITITGRSFATSNSGGRGVDMVNDVITAGGSIIITGQHDNQSSFGVALGNADLTAATGITLRALDELADNIGTTIPYNGTTLDGGSGEVKLIGANVDFGSGTAVSITTTGPVSILPENNAFANPVTTAFLSIANTATSFTIGKTTNTTNVTVGSAVNIAGPISVYGNAITLSANLTTTNTSNGNILLQGAGLTGSGNITVATGQTATINTSGNSTYAGVISGTSSSFTKQGAGTLTLSNTSTYSGATTISAGTIQLGVNNALPNASSLNVVADATLALAGFNQEVGPITGGGVISSASGMPEFISTFSSPTTSSFQGNIGPGAITLIKAGTATLTLIGDNTYTGATSVRGGLLRIGNAGKIGAGTTTKTYNGNIFIDNGASFMFASNTVPHVFSGVISGQGNLIISSSTSNPTPPSTISLISSNTYSGSTTINTGKLILENPGGNTIPHNNNVIVSGSGGTLKVSSNQALEDLTVSSGTLEVDNNVVLTNNGVFTGGGTITNNGTMVIKGGSTFPGAATIVSDMNHLTIDRAGGVTLNKDLDVAGTLTLSSGVLDAGTVTLTVSGSIAGASSTTYIKTSSTGVLKMAVGNSSSKVFPIGNGSYNPVTITNNTGSSDDFSARVSDAVLDGGTTGTAITDKVVKRTWHVGKASANASPGIDMTFSWDASEEGTNMTDYKLSHYGTGWALAAGTSSSVTVNGTNKTMTHTGYTGTFSPFAIGSSTSVLPVTWHSFTATQQGSGALLQWATATEQNTKDFVVEYSTSAMSWLPIGTVAASGNSSSLQYYSMLHKDPVKGQSAHFYRIQQRDLDGKFSYSKIVRLQVSGAETGMMIYPNPARDVINVYLSQPQELRIISITGAEVWRSKLAAGNHQIEVGHLLRGMYIVATPTQQQKVVLD